MYTNTTRITGLSGSGIDTDSMVQKLMHAESSKLYRYQRNLQWKTWQQEAYRNIITKFKDFQSKWFGTSSTSTNLKYSAAFSSFKNTVKSSKGGESEAVTINKSTSAQKYELAVKQLAQADTYVGNNTVGKELKAEANISEIAAKLAKGEDIEFNIALDGVTKKVTLSQSDFSGSVDSSSLETVLNNKLNKLFGTEGSGANEKSKVQVEIAADGKMLFKPNSLGHDVKLSYSGTSSDSIFNSTVTLTDSGKDLTGSFSVKVGGTIYQITVDANTKGDTIAAKINNKLAEIKDADGTTLLDGYLSASIKDDKLVLTSKANSNITVTAGTGGLSGVITNTNLKTSNDLKNYFGITSGSSKVEKSTSLEEIFGDSLWNGGGTSFTINGKEFKFDESDPDGFKKDTNLATFLEKINSSDAGVNISYNATNQKFTIKAEESGKVNEIEFGGDAGTKSVLTALGLADASGNIDSVHTDAQDAILSVDGVETTRATNTFDLEGMNITLNKVTEAGETITLGNEVDVDKIYESITKFVEEYNTLIGDLNTQVKQTRARSDDYSYYEPLTDQEKKEMDEDEIKLWEEKAKTGLVYRDSTITSVLSKMRSTMYSSFTKVDGTKISLYNFGITTSSDYTDNGKLVIDEDKLKAAITNNLEDIQSIFTGSGVGGKGIADKLDEIVNGAVGINGSLREKAGIAGTASANENTLSKEIKAINEKIAAEKERLVAKENKYYYLFSSMETSIINSNSQMDSLLSMLG